jgi:hypothetical protein
VPADEPTIQAGIDAAVDGDEVVVAPGTYSGPGNRDLGFGGKRIVVRSSGGAEVTTIDCGGSPTEPHRAFDFNDTAEPIGAAVEGFEIVNGYSPYGGAIRMSITAVAVRDCVFRACDGTSGGRAVDVSNAIASIIERCRFEECGGPALDAETVGAIRDCEFREIEGDGAFFGDSFVVERCIFLGCTGTGMVANGVYSETEGRRIEDCVITGNGNYGIEAWFCPDLTVIGCTIADNRIYGLRVSADSDGLSVGGSVLYGNCVRDVTSGSAITLECCAVPPERVGGTGTVTFLDPPVTADPLFCNPVDCNLAPTTDGDYHLAPGSPCLAENSPCGEQIGALGPGCDDVSSTPSEGGSPVPGSASFGVEVLGVQGFGEVRFRVTGVVTGPVSLLLLDAGGRRVAGGVAAAETGATVVWSLPAEGQERRAGVYFLRAIDGSGAEAAAKFVRAGR